MGIILIIGFWCYSSLRSQGLQKLLWQTSNINDITIWKYIVPIIIIVTIIIIIGNLNKITAIIIMLSLSPFWLSRSSSSPSVWHRSSLVGPWKVASPLLVSLQLLYATALSTVPNGTQCYMVHNAQWYTITNGTLYPMEHFTRYNATVILYSKV